MKKILLFLVCVSCSLAMNAQKKVDLSFLRGQTGIEIKYKSDVKRIMDMSMDDFKEMMNLQKGDTNYVNSLIARNKFDFISCFNEECKILNQKGAKYVAECTEIFVDKDADIKFSVVIKEMGTDNEKARFMLEGNGGKWAFFEFKWKRANADAGEELGEIINDYL